MHKLKNFENLTKVRESIWNNQKWKKNLIVDIRKQKTIKNCQKCKPPSPPHSTCKKLKFLKNSGKHLEQSKIKKKRIVGVRNPKKNCLKSKHNHPPPPSTLYMQKIEKFKKFWKFSKNPEMVRNRSKILKTCNHQKWGGKVPVNTYWRHVNSQKWKNIWKTLSSTWNFFAIGCKFLTVENN